MSETPSTAPEALDALWQNMPLQFSDLPAYESVPLKPPQPAFRKLMVVERLLWWLPASIGLSVLVYFIADKQLALAWYITAATGMALLVLALLLMLAFKAFANKGYAIREKDILVKKGWLFESMHLMPYERMQHCVVKTGPLERYFGLSTLLVHSAGGASSDLTLTGLSHEEAQQLKDHMSNHSSLHTPEAATPPTEAHPYDDGTPTT